MTAAGLLRQAEAFEERGDMRSAERELRRAIRLLRDGGGERMLARALARLGAVLEARGRYTAAARTLRCGIRLAERSFGKHSLAVARALNDLGVCRKQSRRA